MAACAVRFKEEKLAKCLCIGFLGMEGLSFHEKAAYGMALKDCLSKTRYHNITPSGFENRLI
jgi:hypothetical protein